MIYFTAHTFKCVCHCRRAMFRVLGMYNFGLRLKIKPVDSHLKKNHIVNQENAINRFNVWRSVFASLLKWEFCPDYFTMNPSSIELGNEHQFWTKYYAV